MTSRGGRRASADGGRLVTLRYEEDFPALWTFFGGWFHQDWPIEGPDDVAVIERVINESEPEFVRAVRVELDELLSLGMDEEAMRSAVWSGFGCGYTPLDDGVTMIEWVRSVRDRLAREDD
jgi:CdiI immunity protein